MKKWITGIVAAIAMTFGMGAAPASATVVWDQAPQITWESVPDWDSKPNVHSPAEWNAIKVTDSTFAQNLPASREAIMKKIAGDCQPKPPNGPEEHLCLWNGWSYNGSIWRIPISWLQDSDGVNAINGISFSGSGIDNASKGWWNRTYLAVRLFDNSSCQNSGFYRNLQPEQFAVTDYAGQNDWYNRFSSASTIYDAGTYCFTAPGH